MKTFKETGLVLAMAVCMAATVGMAGCNTFRGAGKDISAGGRGIERAAERNQHRDRDDEQHRHTISATSERYGSISPSGNVDVRYLSDQTFRITPNRGYRVSDVRVNGQSMGPVTRYTFRDVTANHSIDVVYDEDRRRSSR